MKKVLTYIWGLRTQFTKYFIVGVSGFAVDLGTLIFFKKIMGVTPTTAVILNQPIVLVYNFALNKWWSFQNHSVPHKQLIKYLILAFANYLFSVSAMHILHDKLFVDYRLARVFTVCSMIPINFFLYKYWVYKQEKQTQT